MSKIHPTAVIDTSAELDKNITIGPNCFIDARVKIGSGCIFDANVVIAKDVNIGENNVFYPGCVIGKNPQMLGATPDACFGSLVIGSGNIIREFVTIHPSIYPEGVTRIGNDNMIMIGVHIGHDCVIEDNTVISNNTQVSGHCKVETGVWLSGTVQIHQFVTVGRWSYAAGFAGLNRDVTPFVVVSGHYPPEVRTVNKRGLVRAGLNPEQQKAINDAFRVLYRQETSLLENAKALASRDDLDENARVMADSVINSSKHRFGRYLETLRRKEH